MYGGNEKTGGCCKECGTCHGGDYAFKMVYWAKKDLLKEKLKERIEEKYGKKLDKIADLIMDVKSGKMKKYEEIEKMEEELYSAFDDLGIE